MKTNVQRPLWASACKASIAAMVVALLSHGAFAAGTTSAPAVSDLNGSADIRGGATHGDVAGLLSGKVSAPFFHDYGVQFDGSLGDVGGNAVKGIAAHAFYRDPSQGLLGVAASRGWYANESYNRFGVEGECYRDNLTYVARAGFQNGTIHHGEYTNLDLNWYLDDNLVVTPGFRNIAGHDWGRLATEWQPHALTAVPGLALFASTGAGNHGYASGMLGVRYYFGSDKTLIRRHREDDPAATAPDDVTDTFSQFTPNVAPPPPPPPV
jgi:hypothetical protein